MVYEFELYHHGVKGQRWGVRRYQNQDGSLTPRGRKRWAKLQKKYPWLKDHTYEKKNEESHKKKISEMSDDELIKYTNRLRLQKGALQAKKELELEARGPKKESKIKKILGDIGSNIAKEAANAGTQYLTSSLKKSLGIKPDEMETLKKESEKAGYLKNIFSAEEQKFKAKKMKAQYEKTNQENKKPEVDNRSAFQKAVDSANEMAKKSKTFSAAEINTGGHKPKVGETFKNKKKESYSNSYDGSSFGFSINSDAAKTVASAATPVVKSLLTEISSGTKQGILVGSPYSSSYKSTGSKTIDAVFNQYMDKNKPKLLGSGS